MAIGFLTNETQVNATTAGNQRAPATTALNNGGYVTVWASDTGDGSGKAILGQLFAADGSKVGAEFLINTTTAGDQDLPDVVSVPGATAGAVFYVVWQSAEAGGNVIRARRYLEDGTPIRFSPFLPDTNADVIVSGTFGGTKPSAAQYGTGRVAFVWEAPSGDGDGTAIVMSQYTNNGISAPFVVNTTTAGNQIDPRIASGSGGAVVVWESQEPTGDYIRGRIILQAGSAGGDAIVNQAAGEDESLPNFSSGLAIWNSGTSIVARGFGFNGATGGPTGDAFVLNTTPGGVISRSDIYRLSDSTYLAIYFTQSGDDGSSYSLRAEEFDQFGTSLSNEVLVPQQFAGTQEAPTVVQLTNGNVVVTWASEADELGNFEIKQRLLNPNSLEGDSANNILVGTPQRDVFLVQQGGNDAAYGAAGDDSFYFGAAFTAGDTVNGLDGFDVLILQGNYSAGVTFGTGTTSNITGIDSISLFPGSLTTYGDTANNLYSYNLTMLDGNVAPGERLKVNGSGLILGENFAFNGSAETDGKFLIFGGKGNDTLTGGGQGDSFVFNYDGRFASGDTVNGGAGYDVVYLRGDYAIDFNAVGFAGSIANVESVGLLGFADTTQAGGGDGEFDYSIVWNNAMLASGQTITFNGSRLGDSETMQFIGTSENDGGKFRLWGGAAADDLRGGTGDDLIYGGNGGDSLRGGGGSDVFRYQSITESTSSGQDGIQDFASGDLIDLSSIDANTALAGDQAFNFIGGGPFTNQAGQLRATSVPASNLWTVYGDIDGNGVADFQISVVTAPLHLFTAGDFVL
jgi:hypothetical protein